MKVTSKGQVTIPVGIREKLGLRPGTEVEVSIDGDAARLMRTCPRRLGKRRARGAIAQLHGSATTGMSTDEIMGLTRGA